MRGRHTDAKHNCQLAKESLTARILHSIKQVRGFKMQIDDDIIDHDISTRVLIPADQANSWCVSDQVGIVER
jgi:hypothetical protein